MQQDMSEVSRFGSLGRSSRFAAFLGAFLGALLPLTVRAAQIEWSGGGTNLIIATAQRCTLKVVFTPAEQSSLREWRLLWVAEGATGQPLRALVSNATGGVVGACDVRPDRDGLWSAPILRTSGYDRVSGVMG
jgi:hypothetical protein